MMSWVINKALKNEQPVNNYEFTDNSLFRPNIITLDEALKPHKAQIEKSLKELKIQQDLLNEYKSEYNSFKETQLNLSSKIDSLQKSIDKNDKINSENSIKREELLARAYSLYKEEDAIKAKIKLFSKQVNDLENEILLGNISSEDVFAARIRTRASKMQLLKAEEAKLAALPTEEELETKANSITFISTFEEKEEMKKLQNRLSMLESKISNNKYFTSQIEEKINSISEKIEEAETSITFLKAVKDLAPLKRKVFQNYLDYIKEFALNLQADEEFSNQEDFESEEDMEKAITLMETFSNREEEIERLLRYKESVAGTIKLCTSFEILEANQSNIDYWLEKSKQYSERTPEWKQFLKMQW